MADERGKAIELAFAQIEKQFGKGSIMRLGSKKLLCRFRSSQREQFLSTRRSEWEGFHVGA